MNDFDEYGRAIHANAVALRDGILRDNEPSAQLSTSNLCRLMRPVWALQVTLPAAMPRRIEGAV